MGFQRGRERIAGTLAEEESSLAGFVLTKRDPASTSVEPRLIWPGLPAESNLRASLAPGNNDHPKLGGRKERERTWERIRRGLNRFAAVIL